MWSAISKNEKGGKKAQTVRDEGSWLSPVPLNQIAKTVQIARKPKFPEGPWLSPVPTFIFREKQGKTKQTREWSPEGSWLSPHATNWLTRSECELVTKQRNSTSSLFGTGDFNQVSSKVARKKMKCHTGFGEMNRTPKWSP